MTKKLALALPVLCLTMALTAAADTVKLSLANPAQNAEPGSTVSFIATVSAPFSNLADVFLNSDSNNVDFPLSVDDTPFLSFPLSLSPGDSYTGVLFNASVPAFAPLYSTYNGYFEIDGGGDGGASDYLASVTFQVTTTPEPAGGILLLMGFFGLAAVRLRQNRFRRLQRQS